MPSTPISVSRKKRLWILIPIVAGVLLVAGGASAYFWYAKTLPDKTLGTALAGMIDANAVEYAASLKIETTSSATSPEATAMLSIFGGMSDPTQPVKFLLTIKGGMDRFDRAQPKSDVNVQVASTALMNGSPLLGLNIRQVSDSTYMSLSSAPSNMFIDLTPLVGTWVKIDRKALARQFAPSSATETPATPEKEMTKEQIAEMRSAFIELRPVQVVEILKEEAVDGVAARHYRLAVDKEALKAFVTRMQAIMDGETSLAYEKFNDDFDRFSQQVKISSLEIWIGKADDLPKRLLLDAAVKGTEDLPVDGTVTFDTIFKSFNHPLAIEAPAESKTLEDVIGTLMSGADPMKVSTEDDSLSESPGKLPAP